MERLQQTRRILQDLIAFNTVSSQSNLQLIEYAADLLSDLGARCHWVHDDSDRKANLFATLGPEGDGGIVLSGHSDVVPVAGQAWSTDPFVLHEAGGRLYGRGTCDMKGFIAATLAIAPEYAARELRRPVHFSFTYDEETGCLGAQQLIEVLRQQQLRPAVAIVGEPTEMRIIEGHKGCYKYTTTFTGLEGHGSLPDLAVNAVEYAVRYISRLMALREEVKAMAPADSRFQPPWTTLQIGRIAGGQTHNIVAGHCAVDWEMRPVQPGDASYIKQHIQTYCADTLLPAMRAIAPQADIATQVLAEVEGLQPVPDNEARQIVSELTGQASTDVVAFGTEAGLFQQLGLSVVVCGPGSIQQAHKPDEYLSLEQLQACLDMLERLGDKLTEA
ncbi:MAG: acetylornithine deacetylase [Thiolinea sp.]